MTGAIEEAGSLLRLALDVIDGIARVPPSQRTRAAGHLGRQALEGFLAAACVSLGAPLPGPNTRTRLIALTALGPEEVSRAARKAWDGLSRSCHRHPYELTPTDSEIRSLLAEVTVVSEFVSPTTVTGSQAEGRGGRVGL